MWGAQSWETGVVGDIVRETSLETDERRRRSVDNRAWKTERRRQNIDVRRRSLRRKATRTRRKDGRAGAAQGSAVVGGSGAVTRSHEAGRTDATSPNARRRLGTLRTRDDASGISEHATTRRRVLVTSSRLPNQTRTTGKEGEERTLSKTGEPSPEGTWRATTSTTPPIELPSSGRAAQGRARAERTHTHLSHRSRAGASCVRASSAFAICAHLLLRLCGAAAGLSRHPRPAPPLARFRSISEGGRRPARPACDTEQRGARRTRLTEPDPQRRPRDDRARIVAPRALAAAAQTDRSTHRPTD